MKRVPHPNALVGGGSGIGGGLVVVYVLSLAGVDVDPMIAAAIAGGCSALVLFVGREGIRGLVRRVWRGGS
jgi:putative flippase GtrA